MTIKETEEDISIKMKNGDLIEVKLYGGEGYRILVNKKEIHYRDYKQTNIFKINQKGT